MVALRGISLTDGCRTLPIGLNCQMNGKHSYSQLFLR